MAHKPLLNPEVLEALGAEKLAQLVLDEVGRNAPFRKIVNAALAAAKGPEAVARQIDRHLSALEKAKAFIDWQKERTFRQDLDATVRTIVGELGSASPGLGLDRLLRFVATHDRVFQRVDDSSGRIGAIYQDAAAASFGLAEAMFEDELRALPDRLLPFVADDHHGFGVGAAMAIIPHLPEDALEAFDRLLADELDSLKGRPVERSWQRDHTRSALIGLRQAIAEARGDLDRLIALEGAKPPSLQNTFGMAERLLDAGRASEALEWVRREGRQSVAFLDAAGLADGSGVRSADAVPRRLLEARILDKLAQPAKAQELRWAAFEESLSSEALREHLRHLSDFEEFDVLDRAFAHVGAARDRYRALAFFLGWPRLDLAAKLVVARSGDWEGRNYEILASAADALTEHHPLAATILFRSLLLDILKRARSNAYGHAARYLEQLNALAPRVAADDLKAACLDVHADFRSKLTKSHGRKSAFWLQTNDNGSLH
ncbi:DUF6880 family protein [Aureimonas sp. Leaf454]|uniref:DUF6880 family protein n=1 Tax=Aureimonas sp. Leaf454 TaxID=1736381 RepID=UPI000B154DA1|nr:DUF6880 family protein [Aureimonas sp. Leaf454]